MTKPPIEAQDADLLDLAAEWVVRVHADDASEADWLALEAWLSADTRHAEAYDRAEMMWADLDRRSADIRDLLPQEAASAVIDLAPRRTRKAPARWRVPGVALAALAAAVLVTVGVSLVSGPKVQVYDTDPGETRVIALDDGSRINLNGGSHIEVRMGRGRRHVEMAQAEAAFDVAHDSARPFIVTVGEDKVRVVGTEFNIRRGHDLTTVTVRRGVVEVTPPASAPVRLPAGMAYERNDASARPLVSTVAPDAAFAWSTGRLVYDRQPLSRVVADLGRRFATPITVDDAAGKLPFTGVLILDDEAKVVSRLEAFLPVEAHRSATEIRLTSKAAAG